MTVDAQRVAKAVQALKDAQARIEGREKELATYEGQLKEKDRTLAASQEAHRKAQADYAPELFAKVSPVYPGMPTPNSGEDPTTYLGRVGEVFAAAGKDLTTRAKTLADGEEDYKRRETVLKAREEQVAAAFKEIEGLGVKGDTAQKPQ